MVGVPSKFQHHFLGSNTMPAGIWSINQLSFVQYIPIFLMLDPPKIYPWWLYKSPMSKTKVIHQQMGFGNCQPPDVTNLFPAWTLGSVVVQRCRYHSPSAPAPLDSASKYFTSSPASLITTSPQAWNKRLLLGWGPGTGDRLGVGSMFWLLGVNIHMCINMYVTVHVYHWFPEMKCETYTSFQLFFPLSETAKMLLYHGVQPYSLLNPYRSWLLHPHAHLWPSVAPATWVEIPMTSASNPYFSRL